MKRSDAEAIVRYVDAALRAERFREAGAPTYDGNRFIDSVSEPLTAAEFRERVGLPPNPPYTGKPGSLGYLVTDAEYRELQALRELRDRAQIFRARRPVDWPLTPSIAAVYDQLDKLGSLK